MNIETLVGENTICNVYFDYTPYEPQTRDNPAFDAEITINGVVPITEDQDTEGILSALSFGFIARLEIECLESTTNLGE